MLYKESDESATTANLLKDLLIVQLGLAGVPQDKIRVIVRCNLNRVNAIVKHLKRRKPTGDNSNGPQRKGN